MRFPRGRARVRGARGLRCQPARAECAELLEPLYRQKSRGRAARAGTAGSPRSADPELAGPEPPAASIAPSLQCRPVRGKEGHRAGPARLVP